MQTYPSFLFIEILIDRGCTDLGNDPKDINIIVIRGRTGRIMFIDTSEEDITFETGRAYLSQAGLSDLLYDIFPPQRPQLSVAFESHEEE